MLLLSLFLHLLVIEVFLLLKQLVLLQVRCQSVDLLTESHLLRVSLVHKALLLINQILLKLLLSDLLKFHLTLDLSFNTPLLSLFALIASFLFMRVGFEQGLVLFFLAIDAINGITVLSLLLRALLGWGVSKFSQSNLSLCYIFSQNVVNVAVLLLLLRLDFFLPSRLQDLLKLCLLLWTQLVSVLEEFNKLLFCQLNIRAARAIIIISLFITFLIDFTHIILLVATDALVRLHDLNRLSVFVDCIHVTFLVLVHLLLLHLLLVDQELLLLLRRQLLQEFLLLLGIKTFQGLD